MKTDTELEALLRTTLAARAATVDDARRWTAPAPAPRPARRWVPALAAAAAVLVVVAGVLAAVRLTRTHDSAPRPAVPSVCSTSLPASWRDAISHAVLDAGGRAAAPLSVASDGSVIAMRDDGVHPGDGREVVQLRPGSEPKVLYAMPDPDAYDARQAFLVDHWLFVALHHQDRPPKHTIPGDSPIDLAAVMVVDVDTGHARPLATASDNGRLTINSLAVFDGKAYWDERTGYTARTGVVKSYDPRTGETATIYRGRVSWLEVTGAGLVFYDDRDHPLVAAHLPAPVEKAMTSVSRHYLATDGNAYAWLTSPRIIGWWAPGYATPIYHRFRRPIDTNQGSLNLLVAGRLVLNEDEHVIDAVNGAVAKLSLPRGISLGRTGLYTSHDGVVAGVAVTERKGHWIDGYWADAASAVLRVDTHALEPLSC
jgi:hypothetical protein